MARSAHKASVIAQVRSWPYRQSSLSLSFKFDLAFWLDKIAFKFKIDWFLHLKMAELKAIFILWHKFLAIFMKISS